eukprot:SAG31_NODE_8836_length_1377_cov_3.798122_2_plen_104_part_00
MGKLPIPGKPDRAQPNGVGPEQVKLLESEANQHAEPFAGPTEGTRQMQSPGPPLQQSPPRASPATEQAGIDSEVKHKLTGLQPGGIHNSPNIFCQVQQQCAAI